MRATYPSLLARIRNQVGCPAMLEGKRFFPLTGNAHSKDALQQNAVGGLRTGAVHRSYVDAEIVDYALARAKCALFLTQGKVACRHLAGFPSDKFTGTSIFPSDVIIVTLKLPVPFLGRGNGLSPSGRSTAAKECRPPTGSSRIRRAVVSGGATRSRISDIRPGGRPLGGRRDLSGL